MEWQRRRILIVDDDAKFGNLMARALAPEHEAVVLTRAQEALRCVAAGERFDLILCDLMLPGVTGIDFHECVGSLAPELVERILFTTGGAFTPRAEAFLMRTDIRHIEKPFPSLAEFRQVVAEQLLRLAGGQ